MSGSIIHRKFGLPGGNVFLKPGGIGSGRRHMYQKPKITSIPLALPIPFDRLTAGGWQCIKLFTDLHQHADGNALQGTKRILLDCLKLRDELRAYPDQVSDAYEEYMSGAFLVRHSHDPLRSFYIYLSDLFTKLSTVRTYLKIQDNDERINYLFPSLTADEDWKHYPDGGRELSKIPIKAENEKGKSTVISAINLIQEDADRAGVTAYSRFLGEFAGEIQVVPGVGHASASRVFGQPIEIGGNIVALGNLEVATVLLHEIEHKRFNGIVWPLIESSLISVRERPGKDHLEASDMNGEHELDDLMSLLSDEEERDDLSLSLFDYLGLKRKLFTELFARYRELDFAQISYPERPDIFYEIDLLERAIVAVFEVDPVMQAVIDKYNDLKVKRCTQRRREGRSTSSLEGYLRLFEDIHKSK